MPLPTPAEQQALYPSTWDSDLQAILDAMRAKGYNQLADQFQAFAETFHQAHPSLTARQALQAFLATELGKSLAAGIGGTSAVLAGIPAAAAKGAENAYKNPLTGWVGNIEQWIIRGFEMLLGVGLIVVAIAKLAGDTKTGRAAASIATKAALL